MKDNEIIEKIRGLYDVQEPDILHRLKFSDVEMIQPEQPKITRKYISAAVIYAAACLVVLVVLPFIIGGRNDDTKPAPGNSDTRTETVTGDESKQKERYPAPEVNIADDVPEEYHEVLIRYRSAVEAVVTGNIIEVDGYMGSPYEPVHAFTAGMYEARSAMKEPETEKYGYSLKDMNGDGTPELLLITENHVLLEIYTVIDGKAQMVEYFRPRYYGIVMGAGQLYTYSISGLVDYSYTLSILDENGEFVHRREVGCESVNGTVQYYRIEDGVKETITENTYLRLKKRYPDIPTFGGEENEIPYEMSYYPIVRTVKEWIMEAVVKGAAEGKIPDRDYDRNDLSIVGDGAVSYEGMCAFDFEFSGSSFVYSNGEVYQIGQDIPFYSSYRTQICDINRNGKDDLMIYGSGGSGLSLYSLIYFDSDTKDVTILYGDAFVTITVVHEMGEDGEMQYSIYTGHSKDDGVFIGTFEYEDGGIVPKLIYEGTLSEVVWEVLRESRED